jgi:MFS family permease
MTSRVPTLGLRANAAQFTLLVGLNALVGSMVGVERALLPLVGRRDFGLSSATAVLSFVVAFGLAKSLTNLVAGRLADRSGRKRLLVAGWLLALPVPVLLAVAPGWWVVVVANVFLGASQGLAWSMTVLMKIDLAGPARRGLALGLNESAGYVGVAAAAFATGALAGTFAPRTVVWVGGAAVAAAGLALSTFARDTGAHVQLEQRSAPAASLDVKVLRAAAQAGFVNNLNDAIAWGLVPLYLSAHGASAARIGAVAALYPAVWGVGQLGAGWLSDTVGRAPLIVAGMLIQAGGLVALALDGASAVVALGAAAALGAGTALVYPTLLAAVTDAVPPQRRGAAVGVYRFWRDAGLVAGALAGGAGADLLGAAITIALVGALTAISGVWFFAASRSMVTSLERRNAWQSTSTSTSSS